MKIFEKLKNMKLKSLLLLALVGIVGTTTTLAVYTQYTNAVTNTFDILTHETEIEEKVNGLEKTVSIKNLVEDAAYVRMRVVASPEEQIGYTFKDVDGNWSELQADGFYYYLGAVEGDKSTSEAIITIKPEDGFKDPFEVTVYEESCVAFDETLTDVNSIKALFEKIENN